MNTKIAVIGCGWLGFPLAKTLIKKGYSIHGTTTSETKLESLETSGIKGYVVEITYQQIKGDLKGCLSECEIAIINIPPGFRKKTEQDYVQKMTLLLSSIETSSVNKVLFIGSTSVYDDEEIFPIITEKSKTSTTNNALKLIKVEQLFQNSSKFQTTFLRFSGLFAEDRHPAKFLSGRTGLKNPSAPVNLIHRDDCIAIMIEIIEKGIWNSIYNAATTAHPTKQAYYSSICKTLGLKIPEYDITSSSKGKLIDSTRLKQELGYTFKVTIPTI